MRTFKILVAVMVAAALLAPAGMSWASKKAFKPLAGPGSAAEEGS